uniref:Agglutinin domain-containing protein n=1 Tax=Cannabis sativa TaxID=3483 RepID=A0A803PYM2_CANSA
MSELPRFVVIKSKHNGKYLTKITKEESITKGLSETFVNFRGEDITSPLVKFELERAKTKPGWFHIRYCYNNKYLTMQSKYSWYFLASADKPLEEDEIDWKNTMFKPIKTNTFDNDINKQEYLQFQHVTNRYACHSTWEKNYEDGLYVSDKKVDDFDTFKVLDWESLVIFPKTTVAFKSQSGLGFYVSNKQDQYMRALKDANIFDQWASHEVSTVGDGYVRIRNLSTKLFWKSENTYKAVVADSNETTDKYTIYLPIKVADNVVVLQNFGYKSFLFVDNDIPIKTPLYTTESNITDKTKFMVVEQVTSRKIYNINFRKEEGRVYKLSVIEKSHAVADNPDNVHSTMRLTLEFNKTRSVSIRNSVSLTSDVKTTFEIDSIPLIVNKEKIKLSADEVTAVGQWGTTKIFEALTKTDYTLRVPPRTRARVSLEVTQGTCEVPFSYAQKDSFYDGTSKILEMDDGMYTGVNIFNINIKTSHETLP